MSQLIDDFLRDRKDAEGRRLLEQQNRLLDAGVVKAKAPDFFGKVRAEVLVSCQKLTEGVCEDPRYECRVYDFPNGSGFRVFNRQSPPRTVEVEWNAEAATVSILPGRQGLSQNERDRLTQVGDIRLNSDRSIRVVIHGAVFTDPVNLADEIVQKAVGGL